MMKMRDFKMLWKMRKMNLNSIDGIVEELDDGHEADHTSDES